MQLVSLHIYQGDETIRFIPFKEGLNIITSLGKDGNQIGKSTTLRAIKFCLGSDGVNLWKDPDSEITNHEVYDYLTSGGVKFELSIVIDNNPYLITRTLEKRKSRLSRISWINDNKYTSQKAFKIAISHLFGHFSSSPSFAMIMNRLFRLDRKTVNRILKFNSLFTSDDEYRLVYSHIFGFTGHNELEQEFNIKKKIDSLEFRRESLLNGSKEIEYQDRLSSIDEELLELSTKENLYDIKGVQCDAIVAVRQCREEIASLSNNITQLETRIHYNHKTIEDYESKISNVDSGVIASIYREASTLLSELKTTFGEAVEFHNSIFKKKAEYVKGQARLLEIQLTNFKYELDKHLDREKVLFKNITNESHLGGFILIEKEIQEKREERGRISYIIDEIYSINNEISILNAEKDILQQAIRQFIVEFTDNMSKFNDSCKAITKKVFDHFSIYMNTPKDTINSINFTLVNDDKISGDGSPRAASMAIDMAFVEYASKTEAKMPLFTMQDYLEATDEDKLSNLFKLANTRKIQTVVAILNDKLALLDDKFKGRNIVLELSPEDKFFKV